MPSARPLIEFNTHCFDPAPIYKTLVRESVLERVREIDRRAREEGLDSLKAESDPLIGIGMEVAEDGRVTKNGYGVLDLPWLAEQHPEWPGLIEQEVNEIRRNIRSEHGAPLKYLIWAGMGGSAEDKAFYLTAGLINRRVRVYLLDSTDPAKLRAILDHIEKIGKQPLKQALRKCLVVGMAMGMTSYEPVLNLEKLDALYQQLKIPNRHNFLYMTLPGSLLDEFGRARGFRRVELQLDNGNTTAGRHSGPLTRGSLYPLALNGCDLESWFQAAFLQQQEIDSAFQLAAFIQGNAEQGRDKLTLYLPHPWRGGAIWTKQDFEESLGKREEIGVKVAVNEPIKLVNYFPPKDPQQDRCFLVVSSNGLRNPDAGKVAALRRAGYPLAVLKVNGPAAPARYMQFIHYTVFALGYLRKMNFVTQPGVELYKQIARELSGRPGQKFEETPAWRGLASSPHRVNWRGGLSVYFNSLAGTGRLNADDLEIENRNAPAIYAEALRRLVEQGSVTYGELTFFGDTRYRRAGHQLRRVLDHAANTVFRSRLKMPADVYEGPAMNHSYHEMIIGYGRGFSTVILTEKQEKIKRVNYTADYHRAQWLATQQALERRNRAVAALTLPDLTENSRTTLKEFFSEVARRLPRRRS